MRYSNIDALQDSSARSPPAGVSERPSLNQCSWRDLAEGDGHEACQSRFRGQRVVIGAVETAVGDAVADGEELPLAIEQKSELGFLDEVVREFSEARRALDNLLGCGSRVGDSRAELDRVTPTFQGLRRSGAPGNQISERCRRRQAHDADAGILDRGRPRRQSLEVGRSLRNRHAGALEPQRRLGQSLQILRVRVSALFDLVEQHTQCGAAIRQLVEQDPPRLKSVRPLIEAFAKFHELPVHGSPLRRIRFSPACVSDSSNSPSTSPRPARNLSSMRGARTIAVDSPLLSVSR